MKTMTLKQTLDHIKNNPTGHDIQVIWEDDKGTNVGRLRQLIYNEKEETVTIKTNCNMVTTPVNLVSFNKA